MIKNGVILMALLLLTAATSQAAADEDLKRCKETQSVLVRGVSECNEENTQLKDRIADCENTLDRGDRVISEQADTIQALNNQSYHLQRALDYSLAEQAKVNAWYRDPKIVAPTALLIGIALGAFVTKGATR